DQASADVALHAGNALVDQVVVRGAWGAQIGNSTIRNSVVVATGANAYALETDDNGGTNNSTYRNVTAVATGSGGVAIEAEALGATGNATINLANTIAVSGPGGSSVEVKTDWSGAHATIN